MIRGFPSATYDNEKGKSVIAPSGLVIAPSGPVIAPSGPVVHSKMKFVEWKLLILYYRIGVTNHISFLAWSIVSGLCTVIDDLAIQINDTNALIDAFLKDGKRHTSIEKLEKSNNEKTFSTIMRSWNKFGLSLVPLTYPLDKMTVRKVRLKPKQEQLKWLSIDAFKADNVIATITKMQENYDTTVSSLRKQTRQEKNSESERENKRKRDDATPGDVEEDHPAKRRKTLNDARVRIKPLTNQPLTNQPLTNQPSTTDAFICEPYLIIRAMVTIQYGGIIRVGDLGIL
jgi:hypothetical protein